MILACMGMAVGTGNIWRFPRELARNGGGSFLVPWAVALLLWSIPLLMVELGIGKTTRKGPYAAFRQILGARWAWMGGFISLCTFAIMCYYAVVTGWTLRYLLHALAGDLMGLDGPGAHQLFLTVRSGWVSAGYQAMAAALAGFLVWKGTRGIEGVNKLLMPLLILILVYGALRSLSLPGAGNSLSFLTRLDGQLLASGKLWLAGFTQSAWSTGAGWGLMLAYAVYARDQDSPGTIPVATGVGNNAIEVLVGLMIFPAVFSIFGSEAVAFVASAGSTGGVAFEATPLIFSQIPGGGAILVLFFLALVSAALTSLVAMVELGTRLFMDFGIGRGRALLWALGVGLALGLPSALHPPFFDNQDFVWGLGLMLSGLFLCVLVWRVGPGRFQLLYLGRSKASPLFTALMILVTAETVLLLGWWLVQERDGITGQCLLQWGAVILALMLFERRSKNGVRNSA